MRLINPLAPLKYMGGAIPLHIAMIASECVFLVKIRPPDMEFKKYNDIVYMIVAHVACIIIRSIHYIFQNRKRGVYLREILTQLQILIYIMALMHL